VLATCLPSLSTTLAYPSASHFQACRTSLHDACHLSCTLALQHDHFDLLLPAFLLNPVSELHLLLVASDLPDHEFGTLYQISTNLLPLSPRSDPKNVPLFFNLLITGRLVNYPRLLFDVVLDFARVTYVFHITV